MVSGSEDENKKLMEQLSQKGIYKISDEMRGRLHSFYGNYASEKETQAVIKKMFEDTGYVLDPHTAVASAVYDEYQSETKDDTPTVIASTASPYKFMGSVLHTISTEKSENLTDVEQISALHKICNVAVPNAVKEIFDAPVLHDTVTDVKNMEQTVKNIIFR